MKRRLFLSLLLAIVSISALPAKRLMIELTNGTKVYYSFADYRPVIRFENGSMRITTRKFVFSSIAQFAVVDDPSDIETVEVAPLFSPDGMVLTIMSIEPVQVYDMKGTVQQVDVCATSESQQVNLVSLPKGSYVVRCGTQSFTIFKK
jgi:hypothetical protein